MNEIFQNIIVRGPNVRDGDAKLLFGDEPVHFTDCKTMEHLMKELGFFPSVSEAKRAGREGPIPFGFTDDFKASKKRRIWIWNPSPWDVQAFNKEPREPASFFKSHERLPPLDTPC